MANFLNIENLTKSYGDRLLFGDITFGVDEGDKIGIVARNGTGIQSKVNFSGVKLIIKYRSTPPRY